MLETLKQFGFGSLGLQAKDFEDPEDMIQLELPPNRIDLFTGLKGVTFDSCYETRVDIKINGMVARVIDLQNLKQKSDWATSGHSGLVESIVKGTTWDARAMQKSG